MPSREVPACFLSFAQPVPCKAKDVCWQFLFSEALTGTWGALFDLVFRLGARPLFADKHSQQSQRFSASAVAEKTQQALYFLSSSAAAAGPAARQQQCVAHTQPTARLFVAVHIQGEQKRGISLTPVGDARSGTPRQRARLILEFCLRLHHAHRPRSQSEARNLFCNRIELAPWCYQHDDIYSYADPRLEALFKMKSAGVAATRHGTCAQ